MTGQGGKSGENRKAPAATDVHSLQRTIHWPEDAFLRASLCRSLEGNAQPCRSSIFLYPVSMCVRVNSTTG